MEDNNAKSHEHTLEKIARIKGAAFDEERLHSAMLLSYMESVYSIIRKSSTPSPLYNIIYDEKNNNIDLEEAQGNSFVPRKNEISINELDLIAISNLRDIPVLFEGETGVGKTFSSQEFFKTVFPKECYIILRLSGNTFLNNVFQPFLEGKIENGMPVTKIKEQAVDTIMGMFVDEPNRGDAQELLQLFDNEIYNAGEFRKLGIKIPILEVEKGSNNEQKVKYTGRRKKIEIITAQNPASTTDAKFTSTVELDAAIDNRLLKAYYGNAAYSAGSTLWVNSGGLHDGTKHHEMFIEMFAKKILKSENITDTTITKNIKNDWPSLYAWICDPQRTDKPILYSALELSDMMISVLGGINLVESYRFEKKIIKDWISKLKESKINIDLDTSYDLKDSNTVKELNEVIATFKVPIIYRDTIQIKKLADVITTLKNIKDAENSENPVDYYANEKKYVTIREVAGACALLARNKQSLKSKSPVNAINEVINQYISLAQKYLEDNKYPLKEFSIHDDKAGIKRVAIFSAMRDTIKNGEDTEYLIGKIGLQAKKLTEYINSTNDIKNMLIIRNAADLMTFAGFLEQYKSMIDPVIDKYIKAQKGHMQVSKALKDISNVYYEIRNKHSVVMPDIYQHRIQRTLGFEEMPGDNNA